MRNQKFLDFFGGKGVFHIGAQKIALTVKLEEKKICIEVIGNLIESLRIGVLHQILQIFSSIHRLKSFFKTAVLFKSGEGIILCGDAVTANP